MSETVQKIDFTEIPVPWQVPGSYVEVKPGYQNVGVLPIPSRVLLIGQMTSSGTGTALTIYRDVTSALQARTLGGPGSTIDATSEAHFAVNDAIPVDVVLIADASGATAAVWTHTFTGPATANGTLAMNIAGRRVKIGVTAGDTATVVATAWAAAINADTRLPVTASTSAGVVTVTAKNKGALGNDISHRLNPTWGDLTPEGLTVAIAQTTQGATNPDVSDVLDLITTTWYTDIVMPWQDSANMAAADAEAERRFGAMVHLDVRFHAGITGTFSQQIAAAEAVNARFIYLTPFKSPGSPPWAFAGSAAGICAKQLTGDPARQLGLLTMPGLIGPATADAPDDYEKELLLQAGCSVFYVHNDGTVNMQRYVSCYTVNDGGLVDPAWHDVMEQAVASRIRYDWKSYFRFIYPSSKLAPDGSLAAEADPTVCTPKRAKASWMARKLTYARAGWIVNETADDATFLIDPDDPNRLDYRIPYTRIGNLFVDAGQLIFMVG